MCVCVCSLPISCPSHRAKEKLVAKTKAASHLRRSVFGDIRSGGKTTINLNEYKFHQTVRICNTFANIWKNKYLSKITPSQVFIK